MKYSIFEDPDFIKYVCGNSVKERSMGDIVLSLYNPEKYPCDIKNKSQQFCVDCREWLEKILADDNQNLLCELAKKIIAVRSCNQYKSQITI